MEVTEGESGLLLAETSLWELVETGGLVEDSMEETEEEEELLCFPALFLDAVEEPRMLAEPFPFGNPFCFCTKPLCFLEVLPSFLVSKAEAAWLPGAEGGAGWSVFGEQGLGAAATGWPLTLGGFFAFSDEPFTSVLSAGLTGTCLAALGTGVGVEAAVKVAGNDDDDVSGVEATDAGCLDAVWTASGPERCSLAASSWALLCWPPSPSGLSGGPLPCRWYVLMVGLQT